MIKAKNKVINNIFLFALYASLLSVLCLLLWGLNRGFDFSDEGFYMLSYTYPYDTSVRVFSSFTFCYELFKHFEPGILFYRIIRILLMIFSSFVFSFGFSRFINTFGFLKDSSNKQLRYIFPFIAIGTFISYSAFPQTLSYNGIAVFLLQIAAGLMFMIANDNHYSVKQSAVIVSLGVLVSFLFFVKITSAFLMFFLILFFFLFYRNITFKLRIRFFLYDFLFLSIGSILGIVICFFIVKDTFSIIINMPEMISYFPSHDVKSVISFYLFNVLGTIGHIFIDFSPVMIMIFLYFVFKIYLNKELLNKALLLKILLILALFFFFQRAYMLSLYKCGSHYIYAASRVYIFILMLISVTILEHYRSRRLLTINFIISKKREILTCVFLLILPFVGSFGTNILLSIHILNFMFSWFALFYLLISFIEIKVFNPLISRAIFIVILFFSLTHIFYGYAVYPYRLNTSLFKQTEKISNIKNVEGLRFDSETKAYIEKVNAVISKQTNNIKNPPIISLYYNSGLVYIVGGISPGSCWYTDPKYDNATKHNSYSIMHSKLIDIDKTILLIESKAIVPLDLIKAFNERQISYPKNYFIAGRVRIPRVGDTLYIWVPKNKFRQK